MKKKLLAFLLSFTVAFSLALSACDGLLGGSNAGENSGTESVEQSSGKDEESVEQSSESACDGLLGGSNAGENSGTESVEQSSGKDEESVEQSSEKDEESEATSEEASSEEESSEEASSESEEEESAPEDSSLEESSSSEEEEDGEPKSIEELVDFVVDVEAGRDIRVLQLTDVQTISADQSRYAARLGASWTADTFNGYEKYIGQVIERYDPDFIIMTGDNTYGEFDDSGEQFLHLITFMDSFEIPWAPVFGNHDNESNMGVDWQCEQFENSEYCLFKQRELTGNGNYNVGLTQDGELKRVFYMLDSNGCGNMSAISFANGHSKKTAGFGEDQIEWYSESMAEINESYPDANLSMAFHIQIAAFEKAMKQYGYNASTIRANPINLDGLETAQAAGDFGYIGREAKGPWDYNNVVWNTIKEYGVDSVFVGHEHCNSASIEYEGVRLTYGQKSSTFDRYNLLQTDGTILDSNATSAGSPIMGGTFINLSEADGDIVDAGLYLYDYDLGYEAPNTPEEDETKITIDNIPEDLTVTTFDFNGTDFDTSVSTDGIKGLAAQKITDTSNLPAGFADEVYGRTTTEFTPVGIKFAQTVNADRLRAVFVKMYVNDYTVTTGKAPLLRIYNDKDNSILSGVTYESLGGKFGEWVYVDILELMQGARGIITDGQLSAFSLLYRFYGATAGTAYFDSITIVSDGDIYDFSQPELPEGERASEEIRGETCYQYTFDEFEKEGALTGGNTLFLRIEEDSYSLKFDLTPATFSGKLYVYGYTTEAAPSEGISVYLTNSKVIISLANASTSLRVDEVKTIEVGFVKLYNGNTVYTYVKVNDSLVAWELVEAYGKTAGNVAIVAAGSSDSFTIA